MSLYIILLALFVSFSLSIYFCVVSTTAAVDRYSERLTVKAESNMRNLFLFTDARKLFIVYTIVLVSVPAALFFAGFGIPLAASAIALFLIMPRFLFARLAAQRKIRINRALPDALVQIAGAMQAGSTFSIAMQSYVDEHKEPLGQEFSLLLREQRVGARLEDALDNLAERVQTEEMDLVVSAALIAHDIGGNLAEILLSLADTIRRKLDMEGKVNALTAQGKLQGYVVSALPFIILVPLIYFEPEATLSLFNSLLGWIFIGVIVVMVTIGGFFIRKIVNVDI